MLVQNFGEIKSVSLPDHWVEKPTEMEPLGSRYSRRFHPQGDESLQVRLVEIVERYSQSVGETFRRCLESPPHSLVPEELEALLPILQETADKRWFEMTNAQTFDINERRVLWVEGRWKRDDCWSGTMFIDRDGSGREIAQIVCVARMERYEQHQHLFREILKSVEWIA